MMYKEVGSCSELLYRIRACLLSTADLQISIVYYALHCSTVLFKYRGARLGDFLFFSKIILPMTTQNKQQFSDVISRIGLIACSYFSDL